MGSGIRRVGSGITSHGIKISIFFFFEGSDIYQAVPFLWDPGPIYHTFGIKDQKTVYKNGISGINKNIPHYDPLADTHDKFCQLLRLTSWGLVFCGI